MNEVKEVKCYTKLWRYERMLFSAFDFQLVRPVPFKTVGVGTIIFIILLILHQWLPLPLSLVLVYYLSVIPLTKLITTMNPEGKAIHKYAYSYFTYAASRSKRNRYQQIEKGSKYRFPGKISYRKKGVDDE